MSGQGLRVTLYPIAIYDPYCVHKKAQGEGGSIQIRFQRLFIIFELYVTQPITVDCVVSILTLTFTFSSSHITRPDQ